MSKSITPPAASDLWPYADRLADTGQSLSTHKAWSRIAASVRTFLDAMAERRRVRRAERELGRLDDRMLKDIGMTRSEIRRIARFGRDPLFQSLGELRSTT